MCRVASRREVAAVELKDRISKMGNAYILSKMKSPLGFHRYNLESFEDEGPIEGDIESGEYNAGRLESGIKITPDNFSEEPREFKTTLAILIRLVQSYFDEREIDKSTTYLF